MYIVLKPPEVGRRQQCLGCRNFGHPVSRCGYSPEQLQGPGCVIATELEVATVEDLAVPFHSFAGMHQVESQRMCLQAQADKVTDLAVNPPEMYGNGSKHGLDRSISTGVRDDSTRIRSGLKPERWPSGGTAEVPKTDPKPLTVSRHGRKAR